MTDMSHDWKDHIDQRVKLKLHEFLKIIAVGVVSLRFNMILESSHDALGNIFQMDGQYYEILSRKRTFFTPVLVFGCSCFTPRISECTLQAKKAVLSGRPQTLGFANSLRSIGSTR